MSDLPSDLQRYILGKLGPVELVEGVLSRVHDREGLKPYIRAGLVRFHEIDKARFDGVKAGDAICVTHMAASGKPLYVAGYTVMYKGVAHLNLRYENGTTHANGRRWHEWHQYADVTHFEVLERGKYGAVRPRKPRRPEPSIFPPEL